MVYLVIAVQMAWLSPAAPNEFEALSPFAPGTLLARMPDHPRRAVGWALGQLVQEGMTLGQVRWLLGEHQPHLKPLPTDGLAGGVRFTRLDFADYGLSVAFLSGGDGVLRVSGVERTPKRSVPRP